MKIDKAHGQQIQMDCSCVRKMLQFDLPGQWSRLVIGDEEPPMAPTRGLEAADDERMLYVRWNSRGITTVKKTPYTNVQKIKIIEFRKLSHKG